MEDSPSKENNPLELMIGKIGHFYTKHRQPSTRKLQIDCKNSEENFTNSISQLFPTPRVRLIRI